MQKHMLRGLLLFAITAALLLVICFNSFGSTPNRLSHLMIKGSINDLISYRQEDLNLLTGLKCNDYILPSAGADFYYSIIEGDQRGFDPVIEAMSNQKVSITFEKASITDTFLRTGKPIPFIVYSDTAYALGNLYITTLPTISISVLEPDSDGNYDVCDRTNRSASLSLFDNRKDVLPAFRVTNSKTTIRIRGNSSAAVPKKSYRLSLYSYSTGQNRRKNSRSLLGMRTDEDWILYAAGGDPERIRNTFFHNLWFRDCSRNNSLGVTLGVEAKYVEVILNGKYMGLYSLMYPLDKKQVSLPNEGFYYRGISYENTDPKMLKENQNAKVVGGWELRSGMGNQPWNCLADYMTNVNHYNGGDFVGWAEKTLDERNIIDLHLFLSLAQGLDNYYKNNNIIAYPKGDSFLYLLAPWDLDLTWGNQINSNNEWRIDAYTLSPETEFHAKYSLPADRWISLSNTFRAHAYTRWKELRASTWSDNSIIDEINRYETAIYGSGAMAREIERWPTAPYSENLSQFQEYGLQRLSILDSYFKEVLGQ